MSHIYRVEIVPFYCEQIYKIINDIDAYKTFLPGCVDSYIVSRDETQLLASIVVGKAAFRQQFTTRNTFITNSSIHMKLVDGPFNVLSGAWHLKPINKEKCCQVIFSLDFEFKQRTLAFIFEKIFKHLAENMVQAFINRAHAIYHD